MRKTIFSPQSKPFVLTGLRYTDPFQNQGQLRPFDFQLRAVGMRKVKGPFLQPFIPEAITGSIPVQDFDSIPTPIPKHKQMTGQRIFSDDLRGHGGQAIEGSTHVRRLKAEVDADRWGQVQHAASNTSITRCNVSEENS